MSCRESMLKTGSVQHLGHNGEVPTPFWCTIIEKGAGCVFCKPLLLPPGIDLCSSLTYTTHALSNGQQIRFTVRVTPHHLPPYMDTVDIIEELFSPPVQLQSVSYRTETELLGFRAANKLGIELFIIKDTCFDWNAYSGRYHQRHVR